MLTRRKCCCVAACPITFSVNGCRSLKLPGATCSVWTSSAKTTFLGSATTDSLGAATVMVPSPGTYYWEIGRARFATTSGTVAVVACPAGASAGTFTLIPATGYHCIPQGTACAIPASDVIYATTSLGSAVLTYDPAQPGGAGWSGSFTRTYSSGCGPFCDTPAYPGGGDWPAPYDYSIAVIFRGVFTMYYQTFKCPEMTSVGAISGCPVPDGHPTTFRESVTATTSGVVLTSCPPSLAVGGNYSWGTHVNLCGGFYNPCAIATPRTGTWSVTE